MDKRKRVTVALLVGGLAATGVVAAAVPAVAGGGRADVAGVASWTGGARGMGPGASGTGGCLRQDAATGTLTTQQRQSLVAMAEEEKLAGDLYEALAARYPDSVFARIARSEDQHLAAVRGLLDRYGITDPTAGRSAGQFADATVQATYDRLLAQGSTGLDAALTVGRQVERTDIGDLDKALTGLDAADVSQVYQHLREASQHHLAAFGGTS